MYYENSWASVFGQWTRNYRVSIICGISPLWNSSSLYIHLYSCLCFYLYLCLHICIFSCVWIFVSVFMSVFVFVSSIAYLRLSASSLIPLWCAHSETDNARPRPGVHCPYKVWAVFSLFVFVYILFFLCVGICIYIYNSSFILAQIIVNLGCFFLPGFVFLLHE